jgi:hypothetical protein
MIESYSDGNLCVCKQKMKGKELRNNIQLSWCWNASEGNRKRPVGMLYAHILHYKTFVTGQLAFTVVNTSIL